MFSFLFGLAAGASLLLNGPRARRGVAKAVLKGGDVAVALGREARRVSAGVVADFEDAFAEAKAERNGAGAEQETWTALHAQIRQLRAEIASLNPNTAHGPVQ